MFIDTHAHLFDIDLGKVSMDLSNVDSVLVPTYSSEHLEKVRLFCRGDPKYYLAVGVHPEYVRTFDMDKFTDFIRQNKSEIFAIGEIGLDSSYPDFDLQCSVFSQQVLIAKEYHLPISVHLRGSVFDKFFEIMDQYAKVKCALHCFNGGEKELSQAIKRGFYISFATNVTYKGNAGLRKLIPLVPQEYLLLETDSPGLAPSGFGRGTINTSENIHFVAEVLAKELGQTVSQIANTTTKNANKLFDFRKVK